jgi:hypothetical protein
MEARHSYIVQVHSTNHFVASFAPQGNAHDDIDDDDDDDDDDVEIAPWRQQLSQCPLEVQSYPIHNPSGGFRPNCFVNHLDLLVSSLRESGLE